MIVECGKSETSELYASAKVRHQGVLVSLDPPPLWRTLTLFCFALTIASFAVSLTFFCVEK